MQSVFSEQWHLVAELKPQLRQNAEIHRHIYRDEIWYLLRDQSSGQFHRFSENAYSIIGLLNGKLTVNQIWEIACEKLADDMPTQDEIIELLQKLYNANALNVEVGSDIERFVNRRDKLSDQKRLKQMATPFGIKIPLFQPQQFLENYSVLGAMFFNRFFLIIMLVLWLLAINITATHWQPLTNNLADKLLAPDGLILMALVYPIIKIIHEFAHAFAVKKYGGEVHEIGIMLLIFFPVPYVDASAANGFANKYKRMLVAGSGILAELTLASIALIVWSMAEEGMVRALAFYVAITAGISSILFNGNPLLRFDAYYVLADWLELPNLASRSNQYLGHLFKKFIFRLPDQLSPANSGSEAFIFTGYGIAAFIYRILIFIWIGLFVAESYWFIGVIMIIWAGTVTLLLPAYRNWNKLLQSHEVKRYAARFWTGFSTLSIFIFAGLVLVPLPYTSDFQGTVPASIHYAQKTESKGEVIELLVKSGDIVEKGQVLARLDSAELEIEIKKINAQLRAVNAKISASIINPAEKKWLAEELRMLQQNLQQKLTQQSAKLIRANQKGLWIAEQLYLGRYLIRGETIGYINPQQNSSIYALVHEQQIELIQENSKVSIRLASQPLTTLTASIKSVSPAATQELISPVLAKTGGGEIVVDNESKSVGNYFQVVLTTNDADALQFLEERIYIVVEHPREALVYRWIRQIRQSFLSRFDL